MKKFTLLSVSLLSLSIVMAVSSFAWFQLKNNGQLNEDIPTKGGIEILFSQIGDVDEAMMPASLKKGVVSNVDGLIDGSEYVPSGEDLLPKKVDYEYPAGSLITENKYLEYPASIVYNQFQFLSTYDSVSFKFFVRYFNVNDPLDTDIELLTKFTQGEALTFNFFLLDTKLTDQELESISTVKNSINDKVTVESLFVLKTNTDDDFKLNNSGNISTKELTKEQVRNNYCITSNFDSTDSSYNFELTNLTKNKDYYLIVESYYSLPDQMIEGNLPLTGKFVLDINYSQANS